MTELRFQFARGQNLFFTDLAQALVHELRALGVQASIVHGSLPTPERGIVNVLLPPHEYFTLTPEAEDLPSETWKRTIFLSAEQPGTWFFDRNVELAPSAGAVFDINRSAVREYERRGVSALPLQIGYSEYFDRKKSGEQRDIDALFFGSESDRRKVFLGGMARTLIRMRHRLVISDNYRPNYKESESFYAGSKKYELLATSKTLLNIHANETPYFEWLRVVEAICNGCVVISEHSTDYEPLVPGEHFVSGRPETLADAAYTLLLDPEKLSAMRDRAYEFLRSELPLRDAAVLLAEVACELDSYAGALSGEIHVSPPPPSSELPFFRRPDPEGITDDPDASSIRAALKSVLLELLTLRRSISRLEHLVVRKQAPEPVIEEFRTIAYDTRPVAISVLVTVYNYEQHLVEALDSLCRSYFPYYEVIVVDDGSTDGSLEVARDWLVEHPRVQGLLLRHPTNRGLGAARNTALGFARGELTFVLDADNVIYPHCLERLRTALLDDPQAAFSYGIFERFLHDESTGLMNLFPWNPERFRQGNYIDAMALIRTSVLREMGGYATDQRLYGWEDFDLWCRMAEQGFRGRFVPEIVARYRAEHHSMLSLTNLSPTIAFSVLASRAPNVMAGITIPL